MRTAACSLDRRSAQPGLRAARGWAALLVCAVLGLGAALVLTALHLSTRQREQTWRSQWDRLQAQALGHGGLMWVLAWLEDPRPIDPRCRASAGPPGSGTFAQRLARPGTHLRCAVPLDQPPGAAPDWQCECPAGSSAPMPPSSKSTGHGVVEITFEGSGEALLLRVESWIEQPPGASARWRESVVLRQDESQQWRVVVGSWWDDR